MNTTRNFALKASATALLLTISLPAEVYAQQSANPVLEEIVVTSRKRSESLQDIPDSITVFNAATIERAGIDNITDFSALTPNLSAYGNFRPNLTNISIRGLTSTQLGEAPIAFVVDGITVPNIEFINQGLVDIEQIEVIRGPQGALYGKNAIGGAINVVTKKPSDETEGVVKASIGEGGDLGLNATLSGSLSDGVVYRVSGFYRDFDGLIDNQFSGTELDFVEEVGFQGLLGFQVSDNTYVDFRVRYSDGEYGVGWYQNAPSNDLGVEDIPISQNVTPLDESKLFNASVKVEHGTDFGDFIFVAGYNKSDDDNFLDADFSALPSDFDNFFFAGGQNSVIEDSAVTLEARFTSPSENKLRWLAGVYYQDRERDSSFDIFDDPVGTIVQDRESLAGEFVSEIVRDEQDSEAFAVFGQLNYDLTSTLEFTAGIRYDEEERDALDPRVSDSFANETFDEVQPKFSLAWKANDKLLAYTTIARGFRSGGFNEVAQGVTRSFEAEVSDTVELGFKSTLVDGVFGLNGAAFYTQQENSQFTRFNPFTFSLEQLTVSDVDTSGVEFEAWWLPTDKLNIQLGLGVLDSDIKDFDPSAFDEAPLGVIGNSLPRVADWNGNISVTYINPIAGDRELVTNVSANWLGERHFDLENTLTDNSAVYLNASIGVEADKWSVTLRASNLTDEFEAEDAFAGIASPVAVYRNRPRQISAEAVYRF